MAYEVNVTYSPAIVADIGDPDGGPTDNSTGYKHLAPVTHAIWLYVSPVLFVMGMLGNIFCLITLNGNKRMRHSRCRFALSALACVDMSVLCIGLLRNWFKSGLLIGEVRSTSQAMCKVHSFLSYATRHMSSWTLTMLAVERVISVYKPLKAKQWLSKKRTVIFWCCILVFIASLDSPLFWGRQLHTYTHEEDDHHGDAIKQKICVWENTTFQLAFWWMDFALLSGIPFCVLCPCNVLIVTKISCGRRMQKGCTVHGSARQAGQVSSVTLMLLLVCIVFVVTTIPITAFFLAGPGFWNETDHDLMQLLFALCNMLYYTNTAINFILYCLGGSQFRQASLDVIGCGNRRKNGHVIGLTASEVVTVPMLRKESAVNGKKELATLETTA